MTGLGNEPGPADIKSLRVGAGTPALSWSWELSPARVCRLGRHPMRAPGPLAPQGLLHAV